MEITGTVFQIQRFSLDDGPGIRTTVFLKGCPLRCRWCHNPEAFSPRPQLSWHSEQCTQCGACAAVCPQGVHVLADGVHTVRYERCTGCGRCAAGCPAQALEVVGFSAAAQAVIREAARDKAYYEHSGGGVTFSGGEPTGQPEFLQELLILAKKEGLHVCLDTCGQAPWALYEALLPRVDLFLYDYKAADPAVHRQYTGVDNTLILENLRRLSAAGARILLRCPIIPGINDNEAHFAAIRRLKDELPGIVGAQVMPYHNIGAGKWRALGLSYTLADLPCAGEEDRARWQARLDCPCP